MRLIDADALIKKLQTERDPMGGEYSINYREIISEMPTISPLPDWTPCAEGLPKESGRYIVTVKRTVLGKETEFTSERDFYVYLSAGYKWESTGIVDENIIAWMPKFKPAPYRADDTTGKVDHIRDATKKIHELKSPEQCTFRVRSVKDGHGDTERGNDWCNGYQKSEVDDEPCLTCQACKLCAANDQEED